LLFLRTLAIFGPTEVLMPKPIPIWLRILLAVGCALAIWWLAVQLGLGFRKGSDTQVSPEQSGMVPPHPPLSSFAEADRRIPA
jgi:hypothetical protein